MVTNLIAHVDGAQNECQQRADAVPHGHVNVLTKQLVNTHANYTWLDISSQLTNACEKNIINDKLFTHLCA